MIIQGVRAVNPGERLHQPLSNLMLFQQSIITAVETVTGRPARGKPRSEGDKVGVLSRVANMKIDFPAFGPLEDVIAGKPVKGFRVLFSPGVPPEADVINMAEFPDYFDQMISAIFVLHFENCRSWLDQNGLADTTTWPMSIDFARTVRNALAHGGKLEIRPTKTGKVYRTVSWHGLSYSISDHGRQILGTDLYGPDLVALMLDVDDDLVALGADR